jgi:hypothetical protein
MIAASVANLTRSDSAKIKHDATANLQLHTRQQAAQMQNVSERSVNTAKKAGVSHDTKARLKSLIKQRLI